LGTSTSAEAKESFNDFENKLINYVWTTTNINSNLITYVLFGYNLNVKTG
jgi:hypothetical protein